MSILVAMLVLVALTAGARASTEADRAAVQSVISQQLEAFRADDGAAAYSFASPGIRAMFPTEQISWRWSAAATSPSTAPARTASAS